MRTDLGEENETFQEEIVKRYKEMEQQGHFDLVPPPHPPPPTPPILHPLFHVKQVRCSTQAASRWPLPAVTRSRTAELNPTA